MSTLVVVGDKTANEVLEAANLCCSQDFGTIEKIFFDENDFEQRHVHRLSATEVSFIVGIADDVVKSSIIERCKRAAWSPFTVVHPLAVVSPSAEIGVGVFIGPLAVVSSNAVVGDHCIVHIHSSVGHDAVIGPMCSILPGARVSGSVQIGARTLVGSNAFVAAGASVGSDCRIDAQAYVRDELHAGYIASPRAPHPVRRVVPQSGDVTRHE